MCTLSGKAFMDPLAESCSDFPYPKYGLSRAVANVLRTRAFFQFFFRPVRGVVYLHLSCLVFGYRCMYIHTVCIFSARNILGTASGRRLFSSVIGLSDRIVNSVNSS
jgi:hypothetical protein